MLSSPSRNAPMVSMRFSDVCVLFVILLAIAEPAVCDDGPSTLRDVREEGRAKSRFLVEKATPTAPSKTVPEASVESFQKSMRPILMKSCLDCHGPELSEGRLRVDQLSPDLLTGKDVDKWREVYNVLSNSEMPPDGETDYALADADRGMIVDWLSGELNKASMVRRNDSKHSSFRRLTKYEYNYALQDLLGLPYSLASKLPPETASEDGFKNSSELLQMSASQFETYREIGLAALKRATVRGERPKPVTYVVSMQDAMKKAAAGSKAKVFNTEDDGYDRARRRQHLLNRETGEIVQFSNGNWKPVADAIVGDAAPDVSPVVLAVPRSNELKMGLDRFLPDEGIMRVRIRAGRSTMNPDEYASLRLIFSAHTSNNANFKNDISERDLPVTASAEDPEFIDFHIPLGDIQRNPFRKLETKFPRRDEFLHIRNVANSNGREEPFHVLIDHIEITAPFYDQWPPKTHTAIFFHSENRGDETKYGREVLARFLRRIWRRPASSQEVDQFMELFETYRQEFSSFEDAMVEVLATALTTPEFLYVTQRGDAASPSAISDSGIGESLGALPVVQHSGRRAVATRRTGKTTRTEDAGGSSRSHVGRSSCRAFFSALRTAVAGAGWPRERGPCEGQRTEGRDAARAGCVLRGGYGTQSQRHGFHSLRLRDGQRAIGGTLPHPRCAWPTLPQSRCWAKAESRRSAHERCGAGDELGWQGFSSAETRRLDVGANSSRSATSSSAECSGS